MTTTARPERRELAHRTSDGIEVTLFWTKATNSVTQRSTASAGHTE